ncbi:MAG: UPF0175 family protein [Lentimicrobiaceae bacterium]|nr:UPF0175 family protein [Lentimicrobiaceae bacterium]
MIFASSLYGQGKLSLGQAAEVANLSKRTFAEIFPSFQIIVNLYFQPTFCAICVKSAPTALLPFLFLSKGIFKQNLACVLLHL